ncbi:MAG: hypothetical protein H0X37_04170 [Herpetosiphonaceae bacterium]|nr:hypothetical protein [Herpetosiphonaceae bacterium]
MERRQGLLGYLAVGLGVVALIVALGGRFSGGEMHSRYRGGNDPQLAQREQAPVTQATAVPQAPTAPQAQGQSAPQGNGRHGHGSRDAQSQYGGERSQGDRGEFRGDHRGPFGFLSGIFPLLAALVVMGVGFRLFSGGRRGRGGPWQGGPGQHGHGPWGQPQQGQPQQPAPQTPPPPSPTPHTGDTRRFDA